MLSARAGEDQRLDGLQAGADDYLVKPFSARELIARVEMLLLRASIRAVENLQRRQLADIFRQAPAAIAILRGPDHIYEHTNPAYLDLIGQRAGGGTSDTGGAAGTGRPGHLYELLDDVYRSGVPFVGEGPACHGRAKRRSGTRGTVLRFRLSPDARCRRRHRRALPSSHSTSPSS